MILAIDTSSANCSVALFAGGECIARRAAMIGRGHAEQLVPMVEAVLAGRQAERIWVGVGPGSFTGIRVGIAAAQGLAIGWDCPVTGLSSLALIAAAANRAGPVAAAVDGGHGELFVQTFDGDTLTPRDTLLNAPPEQAAVRITAPVVAGPGAAALVAARGAGEAIDLWPEAALAIRLPAALTSLPPQPVYARAPDAKARSVAA